MKLPLYDECDKFLEDLCKEGHISQEKYIKSTNTLYFLFKLLPGLSKPTVGVGPEQVVGFTWENHKFHVNIEVVEKVESFIENLKNGNMYHEEEDLPGAKVMRTLKEFCDYSNN